MKKLDKFAEIYPTPKFREAMKDVISLGFRVRYVREFEYDPKTGEESLMYYAICANPPICASGSEVEYCRDDFLSKVPKHYLSSKRPSLYLVKPEVPPS